MSEYNIIETLGNAEVVEKKSRFIARAFPVESEAQALEIIEKIKKEYWDARHNCFAFVVGANQEIQRFSDDGEPQGTAGKPILEVLLNNHITNALIIVTRYFGGTLLGTGGLVRAYGQAAKLGISNAQILRVSKGIRSEIIVDYNSIGKIKYIIAQMELITEDEQYTDAVKVIVQMKEEKYPEFQTKVADATQGKAIFQNKEEIPYKESVQI